MINFFRRIRKKLADDNKPLKYMRYAIGEILLVVVGILIALSINNWNEDKKVMKYELKILQELYSTIINDIEFQKIQIEENESAIASAEIIIKSFNESFSYSDSLNFHFKNLLNRRISLVADNAYQNAKQYGLDFMENDSLKQELIWTYERNAKILDDINERDNLYENNVAIPIFTELFDRVDFSDDLSRFEIIRSISLSGIAQESSYKKMFPLDYKALKKNNKFKSIVKSTISRREKLIMYQEIRLMRMNRLIKLLELEIASR
ncbi:DUF6090 family protein [uncultured Eudoraea sp.]|uniref:DUF6090 family protein n=1 Tax=uncultured Eudoraea sp. TaxID=1035614 RepID=UPI0026193B2B|nr:DUF6090 family protein [uncultured Eudoraea sp.]